MLSRLHNCPYSVHQQRGACTLFTVDTFGKQLLIEAKAAAAPPCVALTGVGGLYTVACTSQISCWHASADSLQTCCRRWAGEVCCSATQPALLQVIYGLCNRGRFSELGLLVNLVLLPACPSSAAWPPRHCWVPGQAFLGCFDTAMAAL